MKKIEITLHDVSLSGHDLESPVHVALQPLPVPTQWERLLFSRWLDAQRKSGKYPDLNVVNGVITLACRWEDYRQFFHEELEQKVAETNDLYNRGQEEAAQQMEQEAKQATQHAESEKDAARQRLREVAAFNELRRFRAEDTPADAVTFRQTPASR
jgi:hypothetical protein